MDHYVGVMSLYHETIFKFKSLLAKILKSYINAYEKKTTLL